MKKLRLLLIFAGIAGLLLSSGKIVLAFWSGEVEKQSSVIEAPPVNIEDANPGIDPVYIQEITYIANFLGVVVTESQVKELLEEKVDGDLVRRLANIAHWAETGSLNSYINEPVSVVIEFKNEQNMEEIIQGLWQMERYESRNGLGGLRCHEKVDGKTVAFDAIGTRGVADLIYILTREDIGQNIVKIRLNQI